MAKPTIQYENLEQLTSGCLKMRIYIAYDLLQKMIMIGGSPVLVGNIISIKFELSLIIRLLFALPLIICTIIFYTHPARNAQKRIVQQNMFFDLHHLQCTQVLSESPKIEYVEKAIKIIATHFRLVKKKQIDDIWLERFKNTMYHTAQETKLKPYEVDNIYFIFRVYLEKEESNNGKNI